MDSQDRKTGCETRVENKRMLYDVEDTPPWYLCLLLGFQNCLLVFGSSIPVPLLLSQSFCMSEDKVAVSELVGTTFFVTGLGTLIQTTLGVRLPLVQGCSASFLTQAITLMRSRKCPNLKILPDGNNSSNITSSSIFSIGSDTYREIWTLRIREVQGSILVASLFEMIIGCTGTLRFILRFVGPLTITPTLTLIGLSLFRSGTSMASGQWWIAITTVFLFVICSQYLRNVEVPVPGLAKLCLSRRLPLFSLFPVLISIFGTWAICAILTATSLLPEHPEKWGYVARTDIGIEVLEDASWFRFPYPGQWGIPTVSVAGVFSMIIAVTVTMIDAVGNVYACATIADAPPLPDNVVNRGIFMQGVCCMLSGIWGTGNGTTTASDNMSIIGLTKVASLRVIQTSGVMLILFGCFGKFGALFTTIPSPIIGGMLMAIFGIITGVGLSFLQFIDLNSFRNIFILGVSLFFGISLSIWMMGNQEAINTGSDFIDQILSILLSTSMFIGAVIGFVLDNTMPGTDSERGLNTWREDISAETIDFRKLERLKIYELPLITNFFHKSRIAKYLPIFYISLWSTDVVPNAVDKSGDPADSEISVSKETIFTITESDKL